MIDLPCHPAQCSTRALVEESRRENDGFLHRQSAATGCVFELFRRAISSHDEEAWDAIYEQYHSLVGWWIMQTSHASEAVHADGGEYDALINQSFAQFYRSTRTKPFEDFPSVGALLAYLRCCARSTVFDAARLWHARSAEASLEALDEEPLQADFSEAVLSELAITELWQVLSPYLASEGEQMVLLELLHDAKPQDICHRYPHLFETVDKVYTVKRNLLKRLKGNRNVQAVLKEVS